MLLNYINSRKRTASPEQVNSGHFVFKNGEQIKGLPHNPNSDAATTFEKEFVTPFYRIPGVVITDSGRIVVCADYRSKPVDQAAIMPCIAYSDDNGKTWTKKLIDVEPLANNANSRIMDGTLYYYKGVIGLICGAWDGTANNVNWTQNPEDATWQVIRYYSVDNGETWHREAHFELSVTGRPSTSWLGGVGSCVVTKNGTLFVPIQFTPERGKVSASVIYTNDGINWTKLGSDVQGLSETSLWQWINTSGHSEITLMSRRDPNTGNNKAANYFVQNKNGTIGTSINRYSVYDSKIPARGGSGSAGGAICLSDETGNLAEKQNVLVSWAENFFAGQSAYIRDHIVVGAFSYTRTLGSDTRTLRELEAINNSTGAYVNNIPYGGYSNLAFNGKQKKIGIVYEYMGSICYKDLSYLWDQLTYKYAGA